MNFKNINVPKMKALMYILKGDTECSHGLKGQPHLVESTAGCSSDLQMIKISVRVLNRPVPHQLPTIYRTLGENYNERVLPSSIHKTVEAMVVQYHASQLITQRENVSGEIRKILTDRAAYFNIALDLVSISSLAFGDEFTAAFEECNFSLL